MPKPKRLGQVLSTGALALLLATCSFDYGVVTAKPTEEVPSAVFRGFVHRVVDRGAKVLEIRAELAESYTESRRMLLRGVSFTEYDRADGSVATAGSAERAVIYTDSEDAEFSGAIRIDSSREDARIDAEYLAWDSSEKRLTSRLDRSVSIERGGGSWIRGAGFTADLRHRAVSFREAAEGRIVEEAAPPASPSLEPAAAPEPSAVAESPVPPAPIPAAIPAAGTAPAGDASSAPGSLPATLPSLPLDGAAAPLDAPSPPPPSAEPLPNSLPPAASLEAAMPLPPIEQTADQRSSPSSFSSPASEPFGASSGRRPGSGGGIAP